MPRIHYIEHDGAHHIADVPEGWSVMEGAVVNYIPGIDAVCGGDCACAACHVYVDLNWLTKLARPQEMEAKILDCVLDPECNSRLSCQIKVSAALDGLVVRLPKAQF